MTEGPGDYVVRAARAADGPAFVGMKRAAGPGLTSLAGPDALLLSQLAESDAAFNGAGTGAPGGERFFLTLEHRPSGALVGMAQVKTAIGVAKPFFNYRVLNLAQASAAAERRFDLEILMPVNECAGCTEVGSLFVAPEHRRAGIGRVLAQARYMMMAAAPARFGGRIIAELRGVVSADGASPFWERLGRLFFRMSFAEADQLSAVSDNQFIIDLMPKYPIYVALLAPDAQAVIGRTHPDGEGARKMLEQEGFRYDGLIDIFDGGPLVSAPRDGIATVRRAQRKIARAGAPERPVRALLACAALRDFRCLAADVEDRDDYVLVAPDALSGLGLEDGAPVLVSLPA